MSKIGAIIAKEIREALPATIFFLFLFHLIALTKAVLLDDYSITSLRAAVATIGVSALAFEAYCERGGVGGRSP